MRPYREDDLGALHRLWTDPQVRRWLWDDQEIDRATADAAMRESMACTAARGFGHWAVTLRQRGAAAPLIGFCGVRLMEGGGEIELMYGLDPAHWGRGLISEGAAAWLAYAFAGLGRARVWARTDTPNVRSEAVMRRLGMQFVARAPHHGLDTVRYVMTRAAWRTARGSRVRRDRPW